MVQHRQLYLRFAASLKGGGRDDKDKRADDVKKNVRTRAGFRRKKVLAEEEAAERAGSLQLSTCGPTGSLRPIYALMDQQKGKVLPPKKVE